MKGRAAKALDISLLAVKAALIWLVCLVLMAPILFVLYGAVALAGLALFWLIALLPGGSPY